FMSTVATQLNWGASYLVSDFYRRFVGKNRSERHYVAMSRVATVILVLAAAWVSSQLASIRGGWEFVLEVGAGTGGVYLLRWYWWRINAWSEISAMATALLVALTLRWTLPFSGSAPVLFAKSALTTTFITTVVWLLVTLLTQPDDPQVLLRFYRLVRPDARGWKPVASLAPEIAPRCDVGHNLAASALGAAMIYLALFGVGKFLLHQQLLGLALLGSSAAAAFLLYRNQKQSDWSGQTGELPHPPVKAGSN
ncbi:MAG TPA: hypothetical protein VG892_04215, partial [Terriglobales bacterium]|nr:hypothetical protein [Terriglobales bacterium]